MAYKMKGFSGFMDNDKDKKILRKSNRKLIQKKRELLKKGKITKEEFKAAKKEIKGYTDVDVAKEHLGTE